MSHEYNSAIWQLQHTDPKLTSRAKRNILGDFIGGVTGLVTSEQFTAEHRELKETESRVEKILNHQINLEKLMDEMSRDMVNKSGVIAALQSLRIRMEHNAVYQTKKVNELKRINEWWGGGGNYYWALRPVMNPAPLADIAI